MKNLKELRKSKNLTQYELANMLQISQAAIACYENGKREPHIQSLIAYADLFECSVDYLIGREDDFGNITIKNAAPALSDEERRLLALYRSLPRYLQESAYVELKGMSIAVSTTNKRNNKNI